jgi:hypothetical protein
MTDSNSGLNRCPLRAVACFAEQLNIAFRIAPARTDWDNVVKFEALLRAALYTVALISLPDKEPDRFGNGLPLWTLNLLQVFKSLNFAADSLVIPFATEYMMLN